MLKVRELGKMLSRDIHTQKRSQITPMLSSHKGRVTNQQPDVLLP